MSISDDLALAEDLRDAYQAAHDTVNGMDSVAVVMVVDGRISTDVFGDYDAAANLSAATYYAEVCKRIDGATHVVIIGADILDGS